MVERINAVLRTYSGRLGLYAVVTLLCSAVGSTLTWRQASGWDDANPLISGPIAMISLLPALAILALIEVQSRRVFLVAALAGLTVLFFWWTLASSDSSTAVLVFYLGWIVGIPLAAVVVVVAVVFKHQWVQIHGSDDEDGDGDGDGDGERAHGDEDHGGDDHGDDDSDDEYDLTMG